MEERGDQRVAGLPQPRPNISRPSTSAQGRQWNFRSKTLPRPSGRATRVIYHRIRPAARQRSSRMTSSSIRTASPGTRASASRSSAGSIPRPARSRNIRCRCTSRASRRASLGLRADRDGNLWLGNMYQAAIAKFDPKTEQFQDWRCRRSMNIDAAQVNMVRPESSHVDGKVWSQNNGFAARASARPRHRQDRDLRAVQDVEGSRTTSTT